MRQKQPRLIVSFHTTAEAIATEAACRRQGLEGRLISVPRSITSDCGLAWSAPPELEEQVRKVLAENGVEPAGFHRLTV
ncbi:DUF3343 domain-containing protein [Dysosmobacter sp.]|uniref:DUF3343 domain-containing protein n=1 Tax=Dysosmobacter sp. TaxID=2591382 RepID=UPI003A91D480